jgi:hypothetical protein
MLVGENRSLLIEDIHLYQSSFFFLTCFTFQWDPAASTNYIDYQIQLDIDTGSSTQGFLNGFKVFWKLCNKFLDGLMNEPCIDPIVFVSQQVAQAGQPG